MIELLLKGLIIGVSIAMPVGPIGLLCMRNVLKSGIAAGIVTGLGAASADTIYGALAGFGINAISSLLTTYSAYIQIIGALFLCYLGVTTFFAKTDFSNGNEIRSRYAYAFISTFFLTLTNPMTILSFAGIYAGLGMGHEAVQLKDAGLMTLGVFLGSFAWWVILSFTVSYFRDKLSVGFSMWLNKLSGSLLFGFGVLAMVS